MSYHCYLAVWFCIIYCEAVRFAILATAWLLVFLDNRKSLTEFLIIGLKKQRSKMARLYID